MFTIFFELAIICTIWGLMHFGIAWEARSRGCPFGLDIVGGVVLVGLGLALGFSPFAVIDR